MENSIAVLAKFYFFQIAGFRGCLLRLACFHVWVGIWACLFQFLGIAAGYQKTMHSCRCCGGPLRLAPHAA
jgi:hypothetical protein